MIDVTAALHASAPAGHQCADCSIDRLPCPACYAAWWPNRLDGPRGSAMQQFNEQRASVLRPIGE